MEPIILDLLLRKQNKSFGEMESKISLSLNSDRKGRSDCLSDNNLRYVHLQSDIQIHVLPLVKGLCRGKITLCFTCDRLMMIYHILHRIKQ